MAASSEHEILSVDGREIPISNPSKVLFPDAGYTKLDLARYYLAVAPGALRAAGGRPNNNDARSLHRRPSIPVGGLSKTVSKNPLSA